MTSRLPDDQVAELKKAFSVADKNGDGSIDITEMGRVLEALGHHASSEEVRALMTIMDTDKSGTVEFSEFVRAMSDWLSTDDRKRESRKRKAEPMDPRHELHRKVAKFFLQFRQSTQFDEVRTRMSGWPYDMDMGGEDENDVVDVPGVTTKNYTSQEKQDYMVKFRGGDLLALKTAVLAADSPANAIAPVETVLHLLHALTYFRTPMERREIGDDLIQLFEMLHPLIPRFVEFLRSGYPQLQHLTCQVIGFMAGGPRIASLPEDFYMHPNQTFFKDMLIDAGVMMVLPGLLHSPYPDLQQAAMLALGCIARHHEKYRDIVLASPSVQHIVDLFNGSLNNGGDIVFLRKATWVLSILCGSTHKKPPHWNAVKYAIHALSEVLLSFDRYYYDEEVLANTIYGLMFLLPGVRGGQDQDICQRLVELTRHRAISVQTLALNAITKLLVDDTLTNYLLSAGLLPHCHDLMRSDNPEIRTGACKVVQVMASLKGRIQAILDAGLVPTLVKLVELDPVTRKSALRIVRNTCYGNSSQVRYLVAECGVLKVLCKSLGFFQERDEVLADIYKYGESLYNFDIVTDVFKAVNTVLNVGDVEAETAGDGVNPYAEFFDFESIQCIGALLAAIQAAPPDQINAWRATHEGAGHQNAEERARRVLIKIKSAADMIPEEGARRASEYVASLLQQFFAVESKPAGSTPMAAQGGRLLVKIMCNGEVRVMDVPRNITYTELSKEVERRYQRPLQMHYTDADKDLVIIDSQASLDAAVRNAGTQSLKLHLSDPNGVPGASPFGPGASPAGLATPGPTPSTPLAFPPASPRPSPRRLPGLDASGGGIGLFGQVGLRSAVDVDKQRLFEDLERLTHFGSKELEGIYDEWKKLAAADGTLTREQFAAGLHGLGVTDPLIIEQNFRAFDKNRSGSIDFREYIVGLSTLQRGSEEDRLKLMFQSYDVDGNGYLTSDEVFRVYKATQEAKNERRPDSELMATVERLFNDVDDNRDGRLSQDEFIAAVKAGKLALIVTATA